jgi:rubrerythrin/predicted ATPase
VAAVIQFPIIKRLEIVGYELFKTEKTDGISHNFDRGIHAIVGINGLGKTTLLNMLYRALMGPFDQSKRDNAGLLSSKHEVANWRTKRFFRDRVSDGAVNATVEVDVAFGGSLVTVRRRLTDLSVVHLAVDGEELDASQEQYQTTVLALSGAASYFDFYAILRYLVFYLEDRIELIWDRRSQFDMMRVLLFDTSAAQAASIAYDEAQSADSEYRTMRAVVNHEREALRDLEKAAGMTQASEYRVLQLALAGANQKDAEQADAIEGVRRSIESARLAREKSLLDLQEARSAVELEEQAHYSHLFPDLGDTAQHVFLNLLGGGSCFVCGNESDDAANYLRQKLEQHRCPICDSTEEQQERVVPASTFSRERLRRLKIEVDKLRTSVSTGTDEIERLEAEFEQLLERREEDREARHKIREELSKFGPLELPDEATLENARASIAAGEKAMAEAQAAQASAESRYGRIMNRQRSRIEAVTSDIKKRFRAFSATVLAEHCDLSIEVDRRSIGQEGTKFDFPYFEVMMTSGVFHNSPSARADSDSVSESQREFLDIAFRIALIGAVTQGKADSMLVFETPESSLDSLFVSKAGEAFRAYAEDPKRKNVLIASTNLNNEEMLSALMGTRAPPKVEKTAASQARLGRKRAPEPKPVPAIPKAQRPGRIINLLTLAAPNAALRQYRAHYRRLLNQAIGR